MTREEAINWIIATQLGRRNLTPEQKSSLRGKKYNLTKKSQGGDHKSKSQNDTLIREELAEDYKVSPGTIQRDGDFATAVDTLEAEVRQDIRNTVLRRQEREHGKITKQPGSRKIRASRYREANACTREQGTLNKVPQWRPRSFGGVALYNRAFLPVQ